MPLSRRTQRGNLFVFRICSYLKACLHIIKVDLASGGAGESPDNAENKGKMAPGVSSVRYVVLYGIVLVILSVVAIPSVVVLRLYDWNKEKAAINQPFAYRGEDITIKVYMHEINQIVSMNLEDYIKGVIAAEMPAEFELEALKAQAVAARTYAVKHMAIFGGTGSAEHPGADVTTDYKDSQAWLDETRLRVKWGANYGKYWRKINQAVDQTRGLILTYNGEPINAVFHSTSGERTASAKEVWGFDYPYLQSVACTWDRQSPRYQETKEITFAELEGRLGADAGIMAALQSGDSTAIAGIIDRTDSGRVNKVRIGAKTLTGQEIRQKLELRSTNFTVEPAADKLVFKTIGYGHGVGLCQYGANGQAKENRDFRQILTYYYTGAGIRNIFGS
ncbi:stage II sporulation protein D [Sporomusa sphaeroides DSM 2875]|uniref:stage II sporulation protein D n=1 Tax=Sporomusa sphaeroides TaxID=47679 RepID=UPI00202F5012|nr:stage II sporulation protein D [Sporomusa sphaeroides]MCM0757953.1 stage II sporulation protein D [Sporomusa sphaeroides DSM 2875]